MTTPRTRLRRVEAGLIGLADLHGGGEGDVDVDAEIAAILQETSERTAKISLKFQRVGWKKA